MAFQHIELLGESRSFDVTLDSVVQRFTYKVFGLPENFDIDPDGTAYGVFFKPNDDVALAKFVYATFPPSRLFPITTNTDDDILLFINSFRAEEVAQYEWKIYLEYSLPPGDDAKALGWLQFGVSIGGETREILQSLEVRNAVARTASSRIPPDIKRCIGISPNGIEGATIPARAFKFSITNYYTPALWTSGILAIWYQLQTCYNAAAFLGFAAGEVMFMDCTAQGEQYKLTPVTFNFSAKPNANGIPDAPFPDLYALGHDIIDYVYVNEVSENFQLRWPMYRYVHRVADPGNFTLFGF